MRMLLTILGAMLIVTGCSSSGHRRSIRSAATAPPRFEEPDTEAPGTPHHVSEVISYAEAQLGKPYCWGGEGPHCFDCSGLAQMAWSRAGVRIPRTTHDISKSLREIPTDDLQAGDILWWPGHVAIYEGHGWMIDAFNSREGVVRRSTHSAPPRRAFRPADLAMLR